MSDSIPHPCRSHYYQTIEAVWASQTVILFASSFPVGSPKGSWRAPASYVLEAKRVIAGWNAARLGTEVVETEDPIRRKYVPVTVVPRV